MSRSARQPTHGDSYIITCVTHLVITRDTSRVIMGTAREAECVTPE